MGRRGETPDKHCNDRPLTNVLLTFSLFCWLSTDNAGLGVADVGARSRLCLFVFQARQIPVCQRSLDAQRRKVSATSPIELASMVYHVDRWSPRLREQFLSRSAIININPANWWYFLRFNYTGPAPLYSRYQRLETHFLVQSNKFIITLLHYPACPCGLAGR